MIVLALLICAVLVFLLAAIGVESRVGWTPLGYSFVTAAAAVLMYGGR